MFGLDTLRRRRRSYPITSPTRRPIFGNRRIPVLVLARLALSLQHPVALPYHDTSD